MGQREYPKKIDWREPISKCKWCGKSEVSFLWSGKKGQYCSFKCNAAGMYPRSVLLSILTSVMTAILFLVFVIMLRNNPYTSIPSFFGVILAVPVIVSISFIYTAYVGRVLTKERQAGVLRSIQESSENGGPGEVGSHF